MTRAGRAESVPQRMIEIAEVTKTFGARGRAVTAVRDVSLAFGPGVCALVGPNGAGKTTLLALILGFLQPTSGRVRIQGVTPRAYLRRRGAAYLPERFRLPPQWPVRRALRAFAELEGATAAAADQRADTAVERFGLQDVAERAVGELSRGTLQRLGLAQALLSEHELVVLDEPTEGLDPLWRLRFRELAAELRGDGRTVLLASHELAEVERVADRVAVLRDGRVVEVIELAAAPTAAPGPLRYRLDVDAPADALAAAFPRHEADGHEVQIEVADAHELSQRLAALLDRGGVVRAVTPVRTGLEERVRERLEGDGA